MEVAKKGSVSFLFSLTLSLCPSALFLSCCRYSAFYDRSVFPCPHFTSLYFLSDHLMLLCPARFLHAHRNEYAHAFTQIETCASALLEVVRDP